MERNTPPTVDDHGLNKDSANSLPQKKTPGHQGGNKTGGTDTYERVLWCTNLDLSYNYGKIFENFKKFGPIERIKVKITGKSFLNAFITFVSNQSAKNAQEDMVKREDMNSASFSVVSTRNVVEEDSDYLPKVHFDDLPINPVVREPPTPSWYVAHYRDSQFNSIKGLQYLEKCVGTIPQENFKKYGKSLLIKAKNEVQAVMLLNLRPSQEDIIASVKPHSSFNHTRGVIYSAELCDFTEKEILDLCPENIYNVKKLKGKNNALVLSFSSKYLPDYISIRHLTFRVRKYRLRPKQCFNCFEYGHYAGFCKNDKKCHKCSADINDDEHECSQVYCCNCEGKHSPQSQLCSRFCFERDIVEIAHNEYISYGRAKAKLMGANKSPESTYAKVISQIKIHEVRKSVPQEKINVLSPNTSNASNTSPSSGKVSDIATPSELKNGSQNSTSLSVRKKENAQRYSPPKPKNDKGTASNSSKNIGKNKTIPLEHQPSRSKGSKKGVTPSVDESGFWSVEGQKRTRAESPKSFNVETHNSFDLLKEESSPAKKRSAGTSDLPSNCSIDHSHSSSREMEVDLIQSSINPEKPRIPALDRKLSRSNINLSSISPQSMSKTGKSNSNR